MTIDAFSSAVVIGLTVYLAPDTPPPPIPVLLHFIPAVTMMEECGPWRLGCTRITGSLCEVWILSDILTPRQRLEVVRHELAHCSGWTHP